MRCSAFAMGGCMKNADPLTDERDPLAPEAGDPAELLDDVSDFLGRFIAYPSPETKIAHVLWIAHCHTMDAWESTPRLAFLSPEPASGKTRALEITELLVPRPVEAVNVTPAYLFRKVGGEDGPPTILFDEIDTVFGPKAKDNEEIRGLMNAGHRRGAVAGRCVMRGKIVETEEIPAYCALAIAGLGDLPDTILTRSIIIKMQRRKPGEFVQPYRRRVHANAGHVLRDRLEAWAMTAAPELKDAWPQMPHGLEDRNADVWEPLLAIADSARGEWPEKARVAAVSLVLLSAQEPPSLGIRLLSDLKKVFLDGHALSTEAILDQLTGLDESPWGDLRGKPLTDRGLAARLRPYKVKPKTLRIGDKTPRGYERADFAEAWERYTPTPSAESKTTKTSETNSALPSQNVSLRSAADPKHQHLSETSIPHNSSPVSDVLDVLPFTARQGACPSCAGEGCRWCSS